MGKKNDLKIFLPPAAVLRLEEVASKQGWGFRPLSEKHTVMNALLDSGAGFLLTPTAEGPGYSASELAENPGRIEGRMLGGLTVVQESPAGLGLPPDGYVITLAPDGETIVFTGEKAAAEFEAVIRQLPQPFPQPTVLITASQMGLAWEETQICGWVDTRLPDDLSERLEEAIQNLQKAGNLEAGEEAFALDRAVPDVEGQAALERCVEALSQDPPNYAECRPSVLAAPAIEPGAFPAPPKHDEVTGIGLLVALEEIAEEIFEDPGLMQPVEKLPAGDYLIYVRLEDDGREGAYNTWGLLHGPAGDFYIPAKSGFEIIGEPLRGKAPPWSEAVILGLCFRHKGVKVCLFGEKS